MATALDILKRSMRLIGALGAGEEPTADEGFDGLSALNGMLDAWWDKTLAVFYTQSESFSWASGNASRTMGPGGNFATTRPVRVVSAFQRDDTVDFAIEIIERGAYDAIPDKTTGSDIITRIYPEMQSSLVVLYAWPVPSVTATVYIQSLARLQSFAALSTVVNLPPGYQRAIEYNLALEIAPEYQVQVPPLVMANAASSLRGIKRGNVKPSIAMMDVALMSTRRSGYSHHTGD